MVEKNYKYFDLNGIPCRVENYGNYVNMFVEEYERGKGFVPANMGMVLNEGRIISEKQFKELMLIFLKRKI